MEDLKMARNEFMPLRTDNEIKEFAEAIKSRKANLVSIYCKDGDYRGCMGYELEEFYEGCYAYIKLFVLNHNDLKEDKSYNAHEEFHKEFCLEHNINSSFKSLFTSSYHNYNEEWYANSGIDSDSSPDMQFNYILKSTDAQINEGFNIASINFIASNMRECGIARKLMNLSEKVFQYLGTEKVIIQLLKPSLRDFYKKFDYVELKNLNQKEGKELVFMEKHLY